MWSMTVAMGVIGLLAANGPEGAAGSKLMEEMLSLGAEASSADGLRRADLLLRAGEASERLVVWTYCYMATPPCPASERERREASLEAYAARTTCFRYERLSAEWHYNGCHYEQVVAAFPGSDQAADATLRLASMNVEFDCEGVPAGPCVLEAYLDRGLPRLCALSGRPEAARLVALLMEKATWAAKHAVGAEGSSAERRGVATQLRRFDAQLACLGRREGAALLVGLGECYGILGDERRSRESCEAGLGRGEEETGDRARRCLERAKGPKPR